MFEEKNQELHFYCKKGFKLDDKNDLKWLLMTIETFRFDLVIFDPLLSFSRMNENDSRDVQFIMDVFSKINSIGASVIFVHHHRKEGVISKRPNQSLRGSSALSGRIDSHVSISQENKKDNGFDMIVVQDKLRRTKECSPFKLTFKDDSNGKTSFIYKGEESTDQLKKDKAKELIIKILHKNKTGLLSQEIITILKNEANIASRNVAGALSEMENQDWTINSKRDGKKKRYFIKSDDKDERDRVLFEEE